MNIGIYGHSIARWGRKQPYSFITLLQDHFDAKIVNSGCTHCSEERILFELKKSKNLDLAMIFHSRVDCMFVPGWDRDVDTLDKDVVATKIPKATVKEWFVALCDEEWQDTEEFRMAETYLDRIPNMAALNVIREGLNENMFNSLNLWLGHGSEFVLELLKHQPKGNFYAELFETFELNKKYMYHPDLQMNRFMGALTQIDQYLNYKKIPVVHCIGNLKHYPPWFKFTSGVVESDLWRLQYDKQYSTGGESDNSVNPEGNKIIFSSLLKLIEEAQSK
jgi:hypothetical protein